MLYVQTTQHQFQKLFAHHPHGSSQGSDSLIQIQPHHIQILKKSLPTFYTQYDVLKGSLFISKLNEFIDKLFQNIFSINILKDVYKYANLVMQKLIKYQNYINEQNQIFQQESVCDTSKLSVEYSQIIDDSNLQNSFQKRNSFYINSSMTSPNIQKHTLDKEIGNEVDFNFYQPLNHYGEQEWNDNFIEKKLKQCSQSRKKSQKQIKTSESQHIVFSNINFHQLNLYKTLEISIKNQKGKSGQQTTEAIQQQQQKKVGNIISKSILLTDSQNIQTHESESEITQWGMHRSFQYFKDGVKIKEIIEKQIEEDINRKKQILDQQSENSKRCDYEKILRKLKAKAKMNAFKIKVTA